MLLRAQCLMRVARLHLGPTLIGYSTIVVRFRLWVLLLIAIVLPLRSALAFGVECPSSGQATQAVVHEQVMDDCHHSGRTHSDKQLSQHPGHDAACCNAAVMAYDWPEVQSAALSGAVVFATVQAPPASFQSEGPERPPRTL